MVKFIVLIKAKEGMSREAFRAHYEGVHAPHALDVFPMIRDYRRNYFGEATSYSGSLSSDFDVLTELWFDDEASYEAFREKGRSPEGKAFHAEEAKFTRPRETRFYRVDECGR